MEPPDGRRVDEKARFSDEQIVKIVRESQAHGVPATAGKYQVSEQTIYIWKRKFGTMDVSQVAELKKTQTENARLKNCSQNGTWESKS